LLKSAPKHSSRRCQGTQNVTHGVTKVLHNVRWPAKPRRGPRTREMWFTALCHLTAMF